MKFDLAFTLVDLGQPWYKGAAADMIRSARLAYKDHDMRVVQITDNKTEPHPDSDVQFVADTECAVEELCHFKGHFMAEAALSTDRPTIFCDVDLIWNNDSIFRHFVPNGTRLLVRNYPAMPYNSGVIMTGDDKVFWDRYRTVIDNMPKEVAGWWGDQFALTATAEWMRSQGFPVWTAKMNDIAPTITGVPQEVLQTPAVHFKGDRKPMMPHYARLLDKGKGFDFARPQGIQAPVIFNDSIGRDDNAAKFANAGPTFSLPPGGMAVQAK